MQIRIRKDPALKEFAHEPMNPQIGHPCLTLLIYSALEDRHGDCPENPKMPNQEMQLMYTPCLNVFQNAHRDVYVLCDEQHNRSVISASGSAYELV